MCGDIPASFGATAKPLQAVNIDFGVATELYASLTSGRPGLVVTFFACTSIICVEIIPMYNVSDVIFRKVIFFIWYLN